MDNRLAPCPAQPQNPAAGADIEQNHIVVAGRPLLADPMGVLFDERERVLLVADLHLEKGSAFARRGQFLPPYDSAMTLGRLAVLVARYAPKLVVALGDSFHDSAGPNRLRDSDSAALRTIQAGRDWLWIAGNHDPDPPPDHFGPSAQEWRLGPLTLRHEPRAGAKPGEIAGHLHPAAIVWGRSGAVRRKAFVSDGSRCILPAFGAFAGGLNLHDAAFSALFEVGTRIAHALGRDRVYAVPEHRCLPEM